MASFTTLLFAGSKITRYVNKNKTQEEQPQEKQPLISLIRTDTVNMKKKTIFKKKLLQPMTVDHRTQLRGRVRGHSEDDSTRHVMARVHSRSCMALNLNFLKTNKDNFIKHVKKNERKKGKEKMRCRTSSTKG